MLKKLSRKSLKLKAMRLFEYALASFFYHTMRLLPIAVTSAIMGKLFRLGRFHSSHKTAVKNLAACFPEKSPREVEGLALQSWENLGRLCGELPHFSLYNNNKIHEICPISSIEYLEEAQAYAKAHNTGIMMLSGHMGNWELASRMLLTIDPKSALIYRKANNPYVEKMIQRERNNYTSFIIRKGDRSGMRDISKHMKEGGSLGMLADQKMNEGVTVKFFGMNVKAPATAADLALKFNMPLLPGRVIRDEVENTFLLKLDKPIYADENGRQKTAVEITQEIYDRYERWIKAYPSQWFWQHNRFNLA